MKAFPPRRGGFTLVELLIVICIIGILAGLLSTAILQLTKTAAAKRNANNAARLQAAIVEYWHDMGRWPLPKTARPVLKKGKGSGLAGSADDGKSVDTYTYTMSFAGDNSTVVSLLLDATLPDATKKTFLDLHGFSTPVEASVSKWPCEEVVDALQAYEGQAVDDSGSKVTARKDPVLVYFAPFLQCPRCETYYAATGSRKFCDNKDCPHYKSENSYYRFSNAEKKHPLSRAMPYQISFDLFNNVVEVSAP